MDPVSRCHALHLSTGGVGATESTRLYQPVPV